MSGSAALLGITKTHSRPHISDDNPYSESQFRTLKYRPGFPDRFGSLRDSRSFCQEFFAWYNEEHRHSGLGLLSPAVVHYGLAPAVIERRRAVLDAAYRAHPERFVCKPPQPMSAPTDWRLELLPLRIYKGSVSPRRFDLAWEGSAVLAVNGNRRNLGQVHRKWEGDGRARIRSHRLKLDHRIFGVQPVGADRDRSSECQLYGCQDCRCAGRGRLRLCLRLRGEPISVAFGGERQSSAAGSSSGKRAERHRRVRAGFICESVRERNGQAGANCAQVLAGYNDIADRVSDHETVLVD